MSTRGDRPGPRDVALAVFAVICAVAVAGPDYGWVGNRIEPFVFGIPFTLFWNVLWVGLSFVVLLAYHVTGPRED